MSLLDSKIFEKSVLKPVSVLWDTVYRLRRSFYEYGLLKKEYFKVPIISIGNVTFGGTGKTPIIIWLTNFLEQQGLVPVVLTRGYKGDLEHKSGMIKGGQRFRSNPKEYGDEPLLISRKMNHGAVIVGKRRAQNLKKYFHEVKPDVVLLDDGFQHIQLYRSFNIVLFDATLPLDRYQVAPLGYLREGLSCLKDADAFLISRADLVTEEVIEKLVEKISSYTNRKIPIAKFGYRPQGLFDCFDKFVHKMDHLKERNVLALTAIASPDSFYQLLENHGAVIVEKMVYPDHHLFTQEDINDVLMKAAKNNASIIVSEKDMVKIRRVIQDDRVLYVNISVNFQSGEEELLKMVKKVLNLDND
jgi:tetraacyldisaccharide 4'-kinase